jgi:hypothetical protein
MNGQGGMRLLKVQQQGIDFQPTLPGVISVTFRWYRKCR